MSIWTHVCGCIRIDGLPEINPEEQIKSIFGNTVLFNDTREKRKECNVPCGSEGSIQYKILTAGTGLVLYTIPIWGDLRDYEDMEEIERWFNKIVYNNNLIIRLGVLDIEVEGRKAKILSYKSPI